MSATTCMTLQGKSCLKCISHKCGKEYPIPVFEFNCTCGNLLDVKYNDTPSQNLKEMFYQRRNPQGSIFNESGVWRFRELLNFCEIDTDDLLLFSGRAPGGVCVHIGLNYFTREPIRQIILDGEDISIQGDLIAKKLVVTMGGSKSEFSWPDLERNQTYRAMHLAVLSNDYSNICKFDQGLQTMALIESIRSWPKR